MKLASTLNRVLQTFVCFKNPSRFLSRVNEVPTCTVHIHMQNRLGIQKPKKKEKKTKNEKVMMSREFSPTTFAVAERAERGAGSALYRGNCWRAGPAHLHLCWLKSQAKLLASLICIQAAICRCCCSQPRHVPPHECRM